MKFLIDAHLPPSLREVFREVGHDAVHTLDLPDRNASRDGILNATSVAEDRVVVTKDTDFYHSHLLCSRPWKLVLVRTGNLCLRATLDMFRQHLPSLAVALKSSTLVELDENGVSIIF